MMHKNILRRFSWVSVLVLLLLPNLAFAADGSNATSDAINFIIPIVSIVFSVVITLMYYAIQMVTTFLEPGFLLGIVNGTGTASGTLLDVWQVSRDIVNVLFALLLVTVALYTVFKADTSKAKEYASKFVIAVIFVNFSWFGPRVVLDFANVLTATVYSIPGMVNNEACERPKPGRPKGSTEMEPCITIDKIYPYNEEDAKKAKAAGASNAEETALIECLDNGLSATSSYLLVNDSVCVVTKLYDIKNDGMFGGLIANYTKILLAGSLPVNFDSTNLKGDAASIRMMIEFVVKLLANFIFTVAIAFPIMAMAVIFFVRIFIIWITIAFMPFAFIGFLIGDKLGSGNPMQIWDQFWKNALLPAVLAVPICVGMIMMMSLSKECPFLGSGNPVLEAICTDTATLPIIGINNWYEFMWYMMGIGVIYFGFFTATKFTTISEKIGSFFKSFGSLVMKAPLAIPLPTGFKSANNLAEISSALNPNNLHRKFDRTVRNDGTNDNTKSLKFEQKDVDDLKTKVAAGAEEGMRAELKRIVDKINSTRSSSDKVVVNSSNIETVLNNSGIREADTINKLKAAIGTEEIK